MQIIETQAAEMNILKERSNISKQFDDLQKLLMKKLDEAIIASEAEPGVSYDGFLTARGDEIMAEVFRKRQKLLDKLRGAVNEA